MSILKKIQSWYTDKYESDSEAVIISCFFNPQKSEYRLNAFKKFYEDIKHMDHRIIECVIGDSEPQLEENENIKRVYTKNLLWHKESLLNILIRELPVKYKYVFWIDADVIFTNKSWLTDGVERLKTDCTIIQPFEICVHMNQDELEPSFDDVELLKHIDLPHSHNDRTWRSFGATYERRKFAEDTNYDNHGHVGFAWGARREILEQVPLYDKGLIGGSDHIIAHACVGQFNHICIKKSFTDNLDEIDSWSKQFFEVAKGKLGYVSGNLFHIWHGDLQKRQYLKRIQDFTPRTKSITEKDDNGLYVTNQPDDEYIVNYFAEREVSSHMIPDQKEEVNFGGGEFGGAGAEGDYTVDDQKQTENFS